MKLTAPCLPPCILGCARMHVECASVCGDAYVHTLRSCCIVLQPRSMKPYNAKVLILEEVSTALSADVQIESLPFSIGVNW